MTHQPIAEMSDIDKRALRDAFGTFATGVTVITTLQPDGTPRGFTANSFSSVSLDPPLLLVCLAKSAYSCDSFTEAKHFAVNVLSEGQKDVSGLFASQSPDKFTQASWSPGAYDMPLLEGSLCSFTCAQHRLVDAGDHLILIGRVLDHKTADKQPLGYFRGNYFTIGFEDQLVKAAGDTGNVVIGALVAQSQKILLRQLADGMFAVPTAPTNANSLEGLTEMLNKFGLKPQLDHLYAVYQDSETGQHVIQYHGTVSGKAPDGMAFFAINDIPLDHIASKAERSMLARYQSELRHGSFGIYQGDENKGVVHEIKQQNPSVY
ncbi:MAG: flavin reductase (DIM6/NTAB) family NADH-FMN oxidoreductase RutF [Paracoccaceae bacterium]|jgi:flavin reductase (DIM6/NTAB) family NADH-FMN oxidoreductase RutF